MDKTMNTTTRRSALQTLAPLGTVAPVIVCLFALGCSGGGGGGGSGSNFQVNSVNLSPNSVWFINRPITIQFNEPVDFATVNQNSINIRQVSGTPAIGQFNQINATTIEFQPLCPRKSDFSDAGLLPGGVMYELRVLGQSSFGVRSTNGDILSTSEQRTFTTPNTNDPAALFFDTVTGSPAPVIRSDTSVSTDASYVEIGGNPANRVYFERANTGLVSLENGFLVPHNLLSDTSTHLAFMIAFNQPVDPSTTNIDSSRLRVEFLDQSGVWQPLNSTLTLEENCIGTGSLVRIEPLGALPSGSQLRVFLAPEFRDLVGETNSITQTAFAPATTAPALPSQGDSLEEEFIASGTEPGSHEEIAPPLGLPIANWGNGSVSTAFAFAGTGGTGGDFDWEVKNGQVFVLDTTTSAILGGPGFAPTSQQIVVGGVLDLRNFRVVAGGTLKIQGPNPVTIMASGTVRIDGTIEISGSDSKGVSTLNTTNIPEPGASGVAGGGKGGTGSPMTNASSKKASDGQGAFGQLDVGGVGGEASFWTGGPSNVDARRGTGGGGGRFGPDQIALSGGLADQTLIGLDAEPGFNNLFIGTPAPIGANSGQAPPRGGATGLSPFTDPDPNNDFFGSAFNSTNGTIILGELNKPWAGSGGGGGGDAIWSSGGPFPVLPFDPGGDEKGAGGGGGGGSLPILALGQITFGAAGTIKCRGGTGGGGENTNFLDRVGGGSGGASGGHVVLQSAQKIDFSLATSLTQVSINATGGQGGAGAANVGGAQLGSGGALETTPLLDACPTGFPTTQCRGPVSGAGGDGGPGVIQLHTPNGLGGGDIVLPLNRTLGDLCKPKPVATSLTQRLIPTFGRNSVARSLWFPMGLGGFDPSAVAPPFFKPSTFDFGNVNTATGEVQTTAGAVNLGATLLGPANIAVAPALPFITTSGRTMVMDTSVLVGSPQEYFLLNTGLLKRSTLLLSQVGVPTNNMRFDVVAVAYLATSIPPTLQITVSSSGPTLTSFSAPGGVAVELIPTFFKVKTNGVDDSLPASAAVFLKFQAAPATAAGVPDEALAVPAAPGADVSLLNTAPNNADFRFLRFQVEFDIDKLNTGITPTSPLPSLDFMRLPFRY
jgi:hypothetical protein